MMKKTHMLTSATMGLALVHFTNIDPSVGLFAGVLAGSVLPDIDEPQSYIGRKTSVQVMNKRVGLSSLIKRIFGHRGFTHSLLATLLVFIPYFLLEKQGLSDTHVWELHFEKENWLQLLIIALSTLYFIGILHRVLKQTAKALLFNMKAKNRNKVVGLVTIGILIFVGLSSLSWLHLFFLGIGFGYLFHIIGDMFSKSGVPLLSPVYSRKIAIPLYQTQHMGEKIIFGISFIALVYLSYIEFFV